MKKGLIGVVVLAFVALVCGTAFAANFETVDFEATLEWTIFDETGLMPAADYGASALTVPELTLTVGPWSASTEDAYIKYTAEMATVGLYAATSYAIYDLGHDITEAQGFTVEADIAPLSVDVVYTADQDYGVGGTYDAGLFSVGAKYNSAEAYGVQLEYPMDAITFTGQYGAGKLLGATTAYLVKGVYALTAGEITLSYTVSDEATFPAKTTTISGELADFPITDTVLLGATLANIDDGTTTTTTITGTATATLAEGVTLTFEAGSVTGEDFTYSGMIGVAL